MDAVPAHEDYWCPTDDGGSPHAAAPISGQDWVALLKIANGDWSVPARDLACLLERRLVECTTGGTRLTQNGHVALGLAV